MTRHEMLFNIRYSFHLQDMLATWYDRLDKFSVFIQLIVGSSIFASLGNPLVLGAIIMIFSAWGFVYQPGKNALLAELQVKKLKPLVTRMDTLDDEQLRQHLAEIHNGDTREIAALKDAAFNRTIIAMGLSQNDCVRLTFCEKFIARIAGDLLDK